MQGINIKNLFTEPSFMGTNLWIETLLEVIKSVVVGKYEIEYRQKPKKQKKSPFGSVRIFFTETRKLQFEKNLFL